MKKFNELKKGDVIYYYDHCKMKPRTILDCRMEEKEEKRNTWRGYEVIKEKRLILTFMRGPQISIYASYNDGNITESWGNSSKIFSCKEAAEKELNRLKKECEYKIDWAENQLEKYSNRIIKYEII